MDEAEKYQQRLQAIAEKRRMQEEQERAKRDMEDERLRLQQLKRKSLRDQWLMEGPLSPPTSPKAPTSPEASPVGPHSPLWGPHSPGTEKRLDELQEESRRLAEGEPPKEQTEGDKTGAVNAVDLTKEALQNGQEKTTGSDAVEDVSTKGLSPQPEETTAVLTNGSAGGEGETNHITSELDTLPSTAPEPEVVVSTPPPGHIHIEPGLLSPDSEVGGDQDDDVLVMRAERVIVLTDDDLPPQGQEEEEDQHVEEEAKVKEASGPLEPAQGEAEGENVAKVEAALLDSTGDAPVEGDGVLNKAEEVEGGVANCGSIAPNSEPSLQSPNGSAVASVPIYSQQAPPSPRLGPEGEAGPEGETGTRGETGTETGAPASEAAAPGGEASELASPAPPPSAASSTGLFQEVPLVEARGSEAEPGEQEPLLGQAKAPQTKVGGPGVRVSAGARSGPPPGAAAHATPTANSRGGEEPAGVSPKSKTCQCCSVM